MRSDDPIGRDVRKLSRLRRLGPDAVCIHCGEKNPEALIRVKRSLLEKHHTGGSANDEELEVIECRNCHAVSSEAQRDSSIELRHDSSRTSLERLEAVLHGQADFFDQLALSLRRWANELADTTAFLDHIYPDWRHPK